MSKFSLTNTLKSYNVQEFVEFLKKNGLSEFETATVTKSVDGNAFLNLAELEVNSWRQFLTVEQCQRFWSIRLYFEQYPEKFVYPQKKPPAASKPSVTRQRLQNFVNNENFLHSLSSVVQQYHQGNKKFVVQKQNGNDNSTTSKVLGNNEESTYDVPRSDGCENRVEENKRLSYQKQIGNESRNVAPVRKAPGSLGTCFGCESGRENRVYDLPAGGGNLYEDHVYENTRLLIQNHTGKDSRNIVPFRKAPMAIFYTSEFESNRNNKGAIYDTPNNGINVNHVQEDKRLLVQNPSGKDDRIIVPLPKPPIPPVKYSPISDLEYDDNKERIYDSPDGEIDQNAFKNKLLQITQRPLPDLRLTSSKTAHIYIELDPELNTLGEENHRNNKGAIYDTPNNGINVNHVQEDKRLLVQNPRGKDDRIIVPLPKPPIPPVKYPPISDLEYDDNKELIYDSPDGEIDQNGFKNKLLQITQRLLPELRPTSSETAHIYIELDPEQNTLGEDRVEQRKFFNLADHYGKQRKSESGSEKSPQNIKKSTIQNSPLPPIPTTAFTKEALQKAGRLPLVVNTLPRPPKTFPKIEVLDFPGSPTEAVPRQLERESYYRNIDRDTADKFLTDPSVINGTFLVRPHQIHHCILCVKWEDKVYHIRIKKVDGNLIEIESSGLELKFNSMHEVVEYFKSNALSFRNRYNQIIDIYLIRTV